MGIRMIVNINTKIDWVTRNLLNRLSQLGIDIMILSIYKLNNVPDLIIITAT